ncbi:MAG: TlpA disulfide reductase family protein [Acidobacteriota bacterium]
MMKRFILSLMIFGGLNANTLSFTQNVEYLGKLNSELVAERPVTSIELKKALPDQIATLPVPVAKSEQVFGGRLFNNPRKEIAGLSVFLIERPNTLPVLFVDLDENGKLTDSERFAFSPIENPQDEDGQVLVKLPLKKGDFKFFPVRFFHPKKKPEKDDTRYVNHTFLGYAQGVVDIQGRKTLVQYQVNYPSGELNATKGYIGVDTNGDARIDNNFVSYELAYAKDETVVFRAGSAYVSTKSVDGASGKIVLKSHPVADYQRIELEIGSELNDFQFTDFDGNERRLSEFRGKYLLLEFWGTWCGPCVGEIPNFKEAYAKYKARGFEILGMDEDESVEKVKKFLTEKEITWTNATTPSIKDLTAKRFRITAFPTTILLDPQGKIVSLGRKNQLPLRGKELLETLEKLLPTQQKIAQ